MVKSQLQLNNYSFRLAAFSGGFYPASEIVRQYIADYSHMYTVTIHCCTRYASIADYTMLYTMLYMVWNVTPCCTSV